MTIELNGITQEQCKIPAERVLFDLEALRPGEGTWAYYDALWVDANRNLFVDLKGEQVSHSELVDALDDGYDRDDFIYVLLTPDGYIVSLEHVSRDFRIGAHSLPDSHLVKSSEEVKGVVWDEATRKYLNEMLLIDFEQKLEYFYDITGH